MTFTYPDGYQQAYSWQTFRLPILFDPIRAVSLMSLIWLCAYLVAIPIRLLFDYDGSEMRLAAILSAPFIIACGVVHIRDLVKNPVAVKLARSRRGRKLLTRGTGDRMSHEEFFRHERDCGEHYAARGDKRTLEPIRWTYMLELEQQTLAKQQELLSLQSSPAT